MSVTKQLVIYDHRVRWVAVLNMAFVVAGICLALRLGSGVTLFLPVAFLGLFSLFWIRDLLFGFRLKLVSDGHTLSWQDGKTVGRVSLAEVRKVLIGISSTQIGDSVMGWTYVRFQLKSGAQQVLPPNLASGLRARKWRHLKRLLSHMRSISDVVVEPIKEPGVTAEGWEDEPGGVANPNQSVGSETNRTPAPAGPGD